MDSGSPALSAANSVWNGKQPSKVNIDESKTNKLGTLMTLKGRAPTISVRSFMCSGTSDPEGCRLCSATPSLPPVEGYHRRKRFPQKRHRRSPCGTRYFCRPTAEAVWGISDPKATFGVRATESSEPPYRSRTGWLSAMVRLRSSRLVVHITSVHITPFRIEPQRRGITHPIRLGSLGCIPKPHRLLILKAEVRASVFASPKHGRRL
jgi:hypothetical protein